MNTKAIHLIEHISLIKDPNSFYFGHLFLQPSSLCKIHLKPSPSILVNKGINQNDLKVFELTVPT